MRITSKILYIDIIHNHSYIYYHLLPYIDFFGLPKTCIHGGRDNTRIQGFLANSWYKTNAGGIGFYRVDYEKGDWKKLHGVFENNHEVNTSLLFQIIR